MAHCQEATQEMQFNHDENTSLHPWKLLIVNFYKNLVPPRQREES